MGISKPPLAAVDGDVAVERRLFFFTIGPDRRLPQLVQGQRFRVRLWRPGPLHVVPKGLSVFPFFVWWCMHQFRFFSNRDYSLLLIYDGDRLVHRSCIFPRYFRFPFMAKDDLQIGDTWTSPEQRGRGLAAFGLQQAVQLHARPGRLFWYLTQATNHASIRVAEKSGFSRIGEGRRVARFGLRPLGCFVLERELPPAPTLQAGDTAGQPIPRQKAG